MDSDSFYIISLKCPFIFILDKRHTGLRGGKDREEKDRIPTPFQGPDILKGNGKPLKKAIRLNSL